MLLRYLTEILFLSFLFSRTWPQCFVCSHHAQWRSHRFCLEGQNHKNVGGGDWVRTLHWHPYTLLKHDLLFHSDNIITPLLFFYFCASATVWRPSQATGSGSAWCDPTRTAHWSPAAPTTKRCACGLWPPKSARLSCESTNMWWSASPGHQRAPTRPSKTPQAQR